MVASNFYLKVVSSALQFYKDIRRDICDAHSIESLSFSYSDKRDKQAFVILKKSVIEI